MEKKLLGRKATLRQRRSCSEGEQSFEDEQGYRNSEEYLRVHSTEERWEGVPIKISFIELHTSMYLALHSMSVSRSRIGTINTCFVYNMKVIYTTHKSKVYKTPVGILAGVGGGC
jgi:hypothetical protein